ncbi:hypothetical protein L1987_53239 [Smallanthus sonchifolius]|uniref:Uncharacterized protein n=1 Tax=Smallanthus sonchifolius TaxID=185202 RepID=A0ACB9EW49_9ASTR|nr:hypothetical protein L1987_53239 [Smallanthus sonchifolius]
MVKDVGDQVKGSGQRDVDLESVRCMILHGRLVKSFHSHYGFVLVSWSINSMYADVITCTFFVDDIYARVLFDSGANQSFIDHRFCKLLNKTLAKLDKKYVVETANGDLVQISEILNDGHITLSGHVIPTRLLPVTLVDFDIVLGMDCLASNQVRILCDKKAIELRSPKGNILTINGDKLSNSVGIISMLKATKYLRKECLAYLVSVTTNTKTKIEDVPVVAEFPNVFPDELPGIPPETERSGVQN